MAGSDAGISAGASVELNGVNYGSPEGTQAPVLPAGYGAPAKAASSGNNPDMLTLWILLGLEILVIVCARRAFRRNHGG
jgi:hypothetical protein